MSRFDTAAASYAFWRAQYTARNGEYQRLHAVVTDPFCITAEEAASMGFETTEAAADWAEETLYDPEVPDHAIEKASAAWFFGCSGRPTEGLTIPRAVRAAMAERRAAMRMIEHRFPYTSEIESPLDILQAIHDGHFPPKDEEHGLYPALIARAARLECIGDEISPDHMLTVKIDATRDIAAILADVEAIVLGYDDRDNRFACLNSRHGEETAVVAGAGFRRNGDESRAVGLLLFDYQVQEGCSGAEARRRVKQYFATDAKNNFGKVWSDDSQFLRWLGNTRACIKAAEVLKI